MFEKTRKSRLWMTKVGLVALAMVVTTGCPEEDDDDGYDYSYEPTDVNLAPTAYINSSDVRVLTGNGVTLDGSASFDSDGDNLTFQWEFASRPASSAAEFAQPTAAVTSFTPDVLGDYQVRLTVSDGVETGSTVVTIEAVPLPTITSIEPANGPAGTVVTIIGTDFNLDFLEDVLWFNGVEATMTGFGSTWIVATAPQGGSTGPVVLETLGQLIDGPVFTYGTPPLGENLLVNESFEDATLVAWVPDGAGYWQGDLTETVTEDDADAMTSGVVPAHGGSMLKFLGTTTTGAHETWTTAELFQIVDVRAYQTAIAEGNVTVEAAVSFNRVAGDEETDTAFSLVVRAYAGDPSTLPNQWGRVQPIGIATAGVNHGSPGTWLPAEVSLVLPPDTDFVLVAVNAGENVVNDPDAPEFDGHFADAATLILRQQ